MTARAASLLAIMLGSMVAATAAEPPVPILKEGLWESHTQQVIGKEKFVSAVKHCRSHASDKSLMDTSKTTGENLRKRNLCTEAVTVPSPGSYTSEMKCEKDKSVTTTTMTYQGDTSYHMEMHMKIGASDTVTTIDDRYVGSCPADMKPGDLLMPDGKKINIGS